MIRSLREWLKPKDRRDIDEELRAQRGELAKALVEAGRAHHNLMNTYGDSLRLMRRGQDEDR